VMALSWTAGSVVESDSSATIADGLAVRVAIPHAVEVLSDAADRMVLVSEREIAHGVAAFHRAGIRAEPAAGAGLAGISRLGELDGPVVLVVTGSNVDDDLVRRCLDAPGSFPD